MSEPISIITLSCVVGLAVYKIVKIFINLKKVKITSKCCNDAGLTDSKVVEIVDAAIEKIDSPRKHNDAN